LDRQWLHDTDCGINT